MQDHAISKLYQLRNEGQITDDEHLERLLSRLPQFAIHSPIIPGTYWFVGKTINDGDQNTTASRGKITVKEDLTVEGEVYLGEGTNYNPETTGKWQGKTVTGGLFQINETIPTHNGVFVYNGKFSTTSGQIKGTYYWDIKPNATGTFEFQLFAKQPEDDEGMGIKPMELHGIHGYEQDISNSNFCWRWFRRADHGDTFRFVTLEENGNIPSCTTPPHIRPRDFCGTNDYASALKYSYFCWRWMERDGESFKVLTIEDPPYLSEHSGSNSIVPAELAGVNGYSREAKDLLFCWRWLKNPKGEAYRAVTLE